MSLNIIVGAQWGDEGKGRLVDLLASKADYVARYNGGDNAGHSVTVKDHNFKLHLVPSGIIHNHTRVALGNGMVINPAILINEMNTLRDSGVNISPERLMISYASHLINPAHCALDRAKEKARGKSLIGTTLRGISLAYSDKILYDGIRAEAMLSPKRFSVAIYKQVESINKHLTHLFDSEPLNPNSIAEEAEEYARTLSPYIGDVSSTLTKAIQKGQTVVAEGAQGTLLDVDHGTYPFGTSSNPVATGSLVGLGIGVTTPIDRVIGVTKAFQTRVGSGPFPTELFDSTATHFRGTGENPWDEYGTTTGRPRRVGWLDLVLLRYAARVNGLTEIAITKLDILSHLKNLQICVGYKTNGEEHQDLPIGLANLDDFQPIFEVLAGWEEDISDIRNFHKLPSEAQKYIRKIEEFVELPIRLISVGPERDQIVIL